MGIFTELKFNVNQNVFLEIFKNPDKGFGFTAKINKKDLGELEIETFNYLIKCKKKNLLGSVMIVFITNAVGEIQSLNRTVEEIQFRNDHYIIKNSY